MGVLGFLRRWRCTAHAGAVGLLLMVSQEMSVVMIRSEEPGGWRHRPQPCQSKAQFGVRVDLCLLWVAEGSRRKRIVL